MTIIGSLINVPTTNCFILHENHNDQDDFVEYTAVGNNEIQFLTKDDNYTNLNSIIEIWEQRNTGVRSLVLSTTLTFTLKYKYSEYYFKK